MEEDLLRRAADLAERCERTATVTSTAFLTPAEKHALTNWARHRDCTLVLHGGDAGCERRAAFFLPFYLAAEDFDPAEHLCAVHFSAPFGAPGHRDYLGALMGLQIDRSVVGDILVHDEGADIIVLEDVAEFILMNFGKAGRKNLSLTREELSDLRQAVTEEKRGTGSVASPRLDSIASLIFGLPRKDAQARIEKGLVFVNNAPCLKPERQIAEGDRITVRELGRARVESFGGTSRKGRIFLDFVRNM